MRTSVLFKGDCLCVCLRLLVCAFAFARAFTCEILIEHQNAFVRRNV